MAHVAGSFGDRLSNARWIIALGLLVAVFSGCGAEVADNVDSPIAQDGPMSLEANAEVNANAEELSNPDCATCPRICSVLPGRLRSFCLQSCQQRCVSKCEACNRSCLHVPAGRNRD